jgi:hypothetical protein
MLNSIWIYFNKSRVYPKQRPEPWFGLRERDATLCDRCDKCRSFFIFALQPPCSTYCSISCCYSLPLAAPLTSPEAYNHQYLLVFVILILVNTEYPFSTQISLPAALWPGLTTFHDVLTHPGMSLSIFLVHDYSTKVKISPQIIR